MFSLRYKKAGLTAFIFMVSAIILLGGGYAHSANVPDVSGTWHSNTGNEYVIIQTGDKFQWQVPKTGEIGFGEIKGNDISAVWPFGFAKGKITKNPSGWATDIFWNNGVSFHRGPGGGGSPGPGPGSGDPNFSFGPNPAMAGGELWVNLNKNVVGQVELFLNGQHLPKHSVKGNSYFTVILPANAKSGHPEIEYQGKRIRSNQPKNFLTISGVSPTPPGWSGPNFSFGPNPANPGDELWIELNSPEVNNVELFLNGQHIPKHSVKSQTYFTVILPPGVKSGHPEIEYMGKRVRSHQPKNFLTIGMVGSPPGTPKPPAKSPNFTFGPNPIKAGGELWIKLDSQAEPFVDIFLNGQHLPKHSVKSQHYFTVIVPVGAVSGHPEIEFQGKRKHANQPKNFLTVTP
jgi:hypothetical protein